jgi:ribosomal protein S27E
MGLTMSYSELIEDIQNLPRYREVTCHECSHQQKVHTLVIQLQCNNCGTTLKLRGYAAIGSEIEDVVDAVLAWLGLGDDFDRAMERKRVLDEEG